ncbi:hypothetical protein T05_5155 [Trichinella murrelli]|uniref:Uncharacterized protein n=1 Tax=Trichinella murrelli TaxID=144512 RepID=A0A0V0TEX6_9BILA|nr:hypothetical protein T05_5155 [Trichinella murrelli]
MTNDMGHSLLRASQRITLNLKQTLILKNSQINKKYNSRFAIICILERIYTKRTKIDEWSFGSLKKTVYSLPKNTVAMWSCEFFTGILIKTAFLLYSYFHCSLAYLLLNKIAPLVIPRSDKSMEEAVDTADKVTSNLGNELTIMTYALQSATQEKNIPFLYKRSYNSTQLYINLVQLWSILFKNIKLENCDKVAASLLLVQAVVHYNDVPEKETAPMQHFNKLEFNVIPTFPLFTSKRSIRNSNVASSVIVHIYSKSQISAHTEMSCFMSSIILCEDFD